MNNFDLDFFSKFLPEGTKMYAVLHRHILVIINKLIIYISLLIVIPSFFYIYSDKIKSLIPFFVLEGFLYLVFIKLIYDILNWYNDVWVITSEGIVEIEWKIFTSNTTIIKYDSVEGIEIIKNSFIDTIFGKGDIVLHKIGGENFLLLDAENTQYAIDALEEYSKKHGKKEEEEIKEEPKEQNFETVMEVLSKVVEEYLTKTGVKKENPKETKELIESVKEKDGTIDIR